MEGRGVEQGRAANPLSQMSSSPVLARVTFTTWCSESRLTSRAQYGSSAFTLMFASLVGGNRGKCSVGRMASFLMEGNISRNPKQSFILVSLARSTWLSEQKVTVGNVTLYLDTKSTWKPRGSVDYSEVENGYRVDSQYTCLSLCMFLDWTSFRLKHGKYFSSSVSKQWTPAVCIIPV